MREASSGAFAVHEVARDLGMLCLHTNSETSALTADPKLRLPNVFRTCRQGVHDSIVGGTYAANIAKAKNLSTWMTASPDYAYRRDTTAEYMTYVKHFEPDVEVVGKVLAETVPAGLHRDFHQDPADEAAGALHLPVGRRHHRPSSIRATSTRCSGQTETFAVNMADYTALTAVKNLPKGIHSGNRYIKTFPNTPENAAWADAYRAKYNEYPTNWSWENATAMQFLAAEGEAGELGGRRQARRGVEGTDHPLPVRRRRQAHLARRGSHPRRLRHRLGHHPAERALRPDMLPGDWNQIFALEAEWKKSKNFT